MDYFDNPYFLTDLRVNWLTDGVFMLDSPRRVNPWRFMVGPAERVLRIIGSPFPWVAPMVIHRLDPPSGS